MSVKVFDEWPEERRARGPGPSGEIRMIPIGQLLPPPKVFREFAGLGLWGLRASLRTHGQLHPLIVRRRGGKYEIITGHLRYLAAKREGIRELLCIVREVGDREAIELQITENLQRKDMAPIEKARMIEYLMKEFPEEYPNQESVAERLGLDRSTVSMLLKLLELPPNVQRLLEEGEIKDYTTASLIAKKIPPELQEQLAREIAKRGLSQIQAKRAIELVSKGKGIGEAMEAAAKPGLKCPGCRHLKALLDEIKPILPKGCYEAIEDRLRTKGNNLFKKRRNVG